MEKNYQQDLDKAKNSITNTIKALENKIKRLDERIGDLDIQLNGLQEMYNDEPMVTENDQDGAAEEPDNK